MSSNTAVLFFVLCCAGVTYQASVPVSQCPPPPPCAAPPPGCRVLFTRDQNGCIIGCAGHDCECQPQPCPPCLDGYVTDENGCDTCECKVICPPLPSCPQPPPGCRILFNKDENGCIVGCRYDCGCLPQLCPPCPDGYVQDENGCDTCECKAICPPPPPCGAAPPPGCRVLFDTDENGCIVGCRYDCECLPQLCPPCLDGYVQDENGCDTCECKVTCPPPPSCPPPPPGCKVLLDTDENGCVVGCRYDCGCLSQLCPSCPDGYVQDENGCDTCECKVTCPPLPPCAPPPPGCRVLFNKDENGCIVGCRYDCGCLPQLCPPCPDGYVQDENGCDTCECKVECGPIPPCAAPAPGCEAVFVKDENGCITGCDYVCQCQPQLCKSCPGGYVKDENGCDTRECKVTCPPPPPCAPPPEGCPGYPIHDENGCLIGCGFDCGCPKISCSQRCPFGHGQDANGCDTCECRKIGWSSDSRRKK